MMGGRGKRRIAFAYNEKFINACISKFVFCFEFKCDEVTCFRVLIKTIVEFSVS